MVDVTTGLPIAGARLTAGIETATTTADGRFAVDAPAGTVTLVVSATGYHPASTVVDASQRRTVDMEFALAADTGYAERLDIVAVAPTSSPTAEAVRPVDVLRTPGALDNVFRTLHTLPGVMAADELGSRLAVRGGTPDQNLTMMDGVEVHDPFRLFGLASAFNPETIHKFALATGGFSVKYGDRLASLLVVENRDGRSGRVGGTAALSATDGNVVLEGGLPGRTRGSWLATARRTYYDLVAERFIDQGPRPASRWRPDDSVVRNGRSRAASATTPPTILAGRVWNCQSAATAHRRARSAAARRRRVRAGRRECVGHAARSSWRSGRFGTRAGGRLRVVTSARGGERTVVMDRTFPLDYIGDAYRLVDSGHKRGNGIVRP